ncbi:hypothetical protein L3Q65_46240 [Amycolatopsis sp. FU40]|uniref:hypothetical protein n=1 Tax=Amycolatopsis sp. FU40 TaxID=2914159 RepID=UPI001F418B95|nr:hypothetical protein [Amycolatopsis sp. FU40]UKD55176.1 hypothetical protein L3Q65_46240 [Amycolatopsis sp. FU40]
MRGWNKERSVKTVDSTGRTVRITTGLTTTVQGDLVVAIAIDSQVAAGPSAIIPVADRMRLINNLHASFDDQARKTGRRPS